MKQHFWKNPSVFFLLSYVFTWSFWIPRAMASLGYIHLPIDPMILHIAGAFGPAVAAICLTFQQEGRAGLKKLFAPYKHWRVDWKRYAFVLLTRPLIWLVTLFGYVIFAGRTLSWQPFDTGFFFLYLLSQLLVVGVGEELGWVGYALPLLHSRHGFIKANLILGILWGFWHLPFFFTVGDSQFGSSLLLFVLKLTVFRFLFSLAYVQSGSLVLPGLFHVSFNVLTEQIPLSPNDPWAIGLALLFTICMLFITRGKGWFLSNTLASDQTPQPVHP